MTALDRPQQLSPQPGPSPRFSRPWRPELERQIAVKIAALRGSAGECDQAAIRLTPRDARARAQQQLFDERRAA